MKQQKPRKPAEPVRFYTQAEAYVEDLPSGGLGKVERFVRIRFKTLDVANGKQSNGLTPWVTFSVEGLEHLSAQMQAVAENAKRWVPGQEQGPAVGNNMGVVTRGEGPGPD